MPIIQVRDGTSINYECIGEGSDLILVHGLGANLAFWYMGIARPLAAKYRVILYDLRGHGRSDMPSSGYDLATMSNDLHDLLDHLNVDHAHIVGHSFGARVALCASINNPERFKSLTVADTQISCLQDQVRLKDWPYWPLWREQLQRQGVSSFPADHELINFQMLAHFNQLTQDFSHGAQHQPQRRARRPSLANRDMGNRGSLRWNHLMQDTTARKEFQCDGELTVDGISQLSLPVLNLFGEYSHCIETCRQLNQYIESSRVKIMPEAGHFLPAVKPRLFLHMLQQFLSKVEVAPRQSRQKTWEYPRQWERRMAERRHFELLEPVLPFQDSHNDLVLFDRRKTASRPQIRGRV